MKNEQAANDGATTLLIMLIGSLLISSVAISWFLLQIYGVTVSGIALPNSDSLGVVYSSHQNFSTNNVDFSTINVDGDWVFVKNVGRVLRTVSPSAAILFSYLQINNVQANANVYDNTYWINNSAVNEFQKHGDYSIILRYTGGVDQNELIFNDLGVKVPTYLVNAKFATGHKYFYPSPHISQYTNPKIRTVYNDKTLSLQVYFNDDLIITTSDLNPEKNLFGVFGRYYAGVGSMSEGFALSDFQSANPIVNQGSTDAITQIWILLNTVIKITTWTIGEQYLPLEISLIFIGLQEAGIIICVAVIIRG